MIRFHQTVWQGHRRLIIGLVSFIIVALIVIGYGFFSYNAWQQQHTKLSNTLQEVTSLSESVLYGDKLTTSKRQQAVKLLASKDVRGICSVHWLYKWQTGLLASLDAQMKDCLAIEKSGEDLRTAASDLATYINDERVIVEQLSKLKLANVPLKEADFPTNEKAATMISNALALYKPASSEGKKTQIVAVDGTAAIIAGWKALNLANQKQDKTAYQSAMTGLQKNYTDLSLVTKQSNEARARLLSKLKQSEQNLIGIK